MVKIKYRVLQNGCADEPRYVKGSKVNPIAACCDLRIWSIYVFLTVTEYLTRKF